jgi:hypothetical protein
VLVELRQTPLGSLRRAEKDRETEGTLGFGGGMEAFIDAEGSAASSGASELQRWIGRLRELHRAASISRRKTMKG